MAGAAMEEASQVVPDATMRRGAGLMLAGFLSWVVNGFILFLAFLVAAVSTGATLLLDPRLAIARALQDPSNPLIPALPVVLALVAAGAAFVAGLWILGRGTVAREWPRTGAREVYGISQTTRWRARMAAAFVLVYAVVGGFAFFSFSLSASPVGGLSSGWLLVWLFASVALVAGGVMFSQFGRALYIDSGYLLTVRGTLLTEYAVANLIGLTFFVIASFGSADVAKVMDILGYFTLMLFVPLNSIVAFSALLLDFVTVRKTRALARPVHIAAPVAGPLPTPTPGTPTESRAGALDAGWVSGLQARLADLERRVREQQDSLSQLRLLVSSQGNNVGRAGLRLPEEEPPAGPGLDTTEGGRIRLRRKDEPPVGESTP